MGPLACALASWLPVTGSALSLCEKAQGQRQIGLTGSVAKTNTALVTHTGGNRDDLEAARRIVVKFLGSQRARLFLFGSRARGDARRASDIDVALLPEAPLISGTLARIREALEESHIPYRVEVIDLSTVGEAFRRRVLAEGVPWND
jgi:predicted nucleotidyltransferase